MTTAVPSPAMRHSALLWVAALFVAPYAASATETVSYTYDAKGRIVKTLRTGSVNNNVAYDYAFDKADNRTKVKVLNSPNPPPARLIVVPLNGFTVIPIPY